MMIIGNCEFTGLIRDIKAIAADLELSGKGASGVTFVARLLALANMTTEAAEMVKKEPALNGLYWEIIKFYADQKKGEAK